MSRTFTVAAPNRLLSPGGVMPKEWERIDTINFFHDSDFKGETRIVIRGNPDIGVISVPTRALLAFAAEYVRSKRIEAVEQQDVEELLS